MSVVGGKPERQTVNVEKYAGDGFI